MTLESTITIYQKGNIMKLSSSTKGKCLHMASYTCPLEKKTAKTSMYLLQTLSHSRDTRFL